MTAWRNHIVYNDGEVEDDLIAEFVKYSALYKDMNYSIFEIGQYVFRNLPDGLSRGSQFGAVWGNDLGVRERIRNYVSPAAGESERDYLIRQAKRIVEDPDSEGKDKVAALVVIGRLAGEFKKEVEPGTGLPKGMGLPKFEYVQMDYDRDPPPPDDE